MLMWMDLMRANQTAIPRLPIPSLQSNPSPYAAAAVAAAAMNLSPVVLQKAPEQREALNLGKKCQGTNNNNAGENDDEPSAAKRIKTEQTTPSSPPPQPPPQHTPAKAEIIGRTISSGLKMSPPSAGTDRGSPPVCEPVSLERIKTEENESDDNNMIEMDIDVSAGLPNGLDICVCKRTKDGIYKGQLVKVESMLNGGPKNNNTTGSFVLRLNGELYTGCLQLQNDILNHDDDDEKKCS